MCVPIPVSNLLHAMYDLTWLTTQHNLLFMAAIFSCTCGASWLNTGWWSSILYMLTARLFAHQMRFLIPKHSKDKCQTVCTVNTISTHYVHTHTYIYMYIYINNLDICRLVRLSFLAQLRQLLNT